MRGTGSGLLASAAALFVACSSSAVPVTVAATAPVASRPPPTAAARVVPTSSLSPSPLPTPRPFGLRIDPSAPAAGQPFTAMIDGLAPGEVVGLVLTTGGHALGRPLPLTADGSGEATNRLTFNDPPPAMTLTATRQTGESASIEVHFAGAGVLPPASVAAVPTTAAAPVAAPAGTPMPAAPPPAHLGTAGCTPTSGPSGTRFLCEFFGLPANATGSFCVNMVATGQQIGCFQDLPSDAMGYVNVNYAFARSPGAYIGTLKLGGQTQTAKFTVSP